MPRRVKNSRHVTQPSKPTYLARKHIATCGSTEWSASKTLGSEGVDTCRRKHWVVMQTEASHVRRGAREVPPSLTAHGPMDHEPRCLGPAANRGQGWLSIGTSGMMWWLCGMTAMTRGRHMMTQVTAHLTEVTTVGGHEFKQCMPPLLTYAMVRHRASTANYQHAFCDYFEDNLIDLRQDHNSCQAYARLQPRAIVFSVSARLRSCMYVKERSYLLIL